MAAFSCQLRFTRGTDTNLNAWTVSQRDPSKTFSSKQEKKLCALNYEITLFEAQFRSDWTVVKSAQSENFINPVESTAVHYSPTIQPDMAKFLEKSNQFRFCGGESDRAL